MQRLQRLSGNDALMLNMENPTTPMHTLKVAIIDSSRRGKPVTLDELIEVLPDYLGHFPRATQRVETASQTYSARPFWVYDENFNVADHLDERTAQEPGTGMPWMRSSPIWPSSSSTAPGHCGR